MRRVEALTQWTRRPWSWLLLAGVVVGFGPQPVAAQLFSITQITNTIGALNVQASISANGTRIAFVSAQDLTGGNADQNFEIFLFDTTSMVFTQITNTTFRVNTQPSINADGTRIAFSSDADLTPGSPGNADSNFEIFLFDTITGLFTQISNSADFPHGNVQPSINAAGTRIAFQANADPTGGNADHNFEIFLFDSLTGLSQITNTTGGDNGPPSINAAGTRIAFESSQNFTGGNADGNREIFVFDTTPSTFTQVTNTTGGVLNEVPSINATGTRIAFESTFDYTPGSPGNADGNREIFLVDTTTGLFTQVTNTTLGLTLMPSINAAGTRIAFVSNRNLTGGNADLNLEIFLFDSTTGLLTQITHTTGGSGSDNLDPSIDAAGTRIAFNSTRNHTPGSPGNADGNSEIFLASSALAGTATPIPTLSEWAHLGMVALLVLGGLLALRRRVT